MIISTSRNRSNDFSRPGKTATKAGAMSLFRDVLIILTLVDTGLRATELCSLNTGDVDMKTGRIVVKHGVTGGAKGGKGRTVFLGKTARRAVWMYLVSREDQGDDPDERLFIGKFDRSMYSKFGIIRISQKQR